MSTASRRTVGLGSTARILVAGLLAATAVTTAQAYYQSDGAGAGVAGTAAGSGVTLTPATVSDTLYPGDTAQVALTATNVGPTEARIGSLVLDTTQGTNGFGRVTGSPSCGLTTFSYTTQNNAGDGWTVPANGSVTIVLPDAVAASTTTAQACQGATLSVYLQASG